MKEKIKKEKYNLIILAIFIMCALFSLPNYLKVHQKDEANYTKHYEECQQNPNENICKYYKEPYLKRDTFNTMGYILLVEDYTSILQMLSPTSYNVRSNTNF